MTSGRGEGRPKPSIEPMDVEEKLRTFDPEVEVKLRFLVAAERSGRIIGKGGENVKALRDKFDCKVQIPDSKTPERVLSVIGKVGQVFSTIEEALGKVQKNDPSSEKPAQFEVRQLVHQSQAGAVIGTAGSRIKQLREELNCQVRCFPDVCPGSSDRIVRVAGEREQVIKCLKVIYQLCEASPARGGVKEYDARFYDPMAVSNYGGIGSELAARESGYNNQGPSSYPSYQNSMPYPDQSHRPYDQGYGGGYNGRDSFGDMNNGQHFGKRYGGNDYQPRGSNNSQGYGNSYRQDDRQAGYDNFNNSNSYAPYQGGMNGQYSHKPRQQSPQDYHPANRDGANSPGGYNKHANPGARFPNPNTSANKPDNSYPYANSGSRMDNSFNSGSNNAYVPQHPASSSFDGSYQGPYSQAPSMGGSMPNQYPTMPQGNSGYSNYAPKFGSAGKNNFAGRPAGNMANKAKNAM